MHRGHEPLAEQQTVPGQNLRHGAPAHIRHTMAAGDVRVQPTAHVVPDDADECADDAYVVSHHLSPKVRLGLLAP